MSVTATFILRVIKAFPIAAGDMPQFIEANSSVLSSLPAAEKRVVWNAMRGSA